jgi:SAM-dependent methyltransferase
VKEINLIDHPFRREMMPKVRLEYRGFGYEYFDAPGSLSGFRGYRPDGNPAEGRRDFAAEARAIAAIPGVRTVLDVGCAKGFLVKALRDAGIDARGVDLSEYAVGAADSSIRGFLRVMSAQDLSAWERYDLVHLSGVLVYLSVSDIRSALRRFHEIARVGIVVKEPTREEILRWYEGADPASLDPLRKQELSQAEWDGLVAAAGFEKQAGYFRRIRRGVDSAGVFAGEPARSSEIPGG